MLFLPIEKNASRWFVVVGGRNTWDVIFLPFLSLSLIVNTTCLCVCRALFLLQGMSEGQAVTRISKPVMWLSRQASGVFSAKYLSPLIYPPCSKVAGSKWLEIVIVSFFCLSLQINFDIHSSSVFPAVIQQCQFIAKQCLTADVQCWS